MFQKSKINKRGSILAFSLIIIAMMMTIAIGTATTSVIQKKTATSTESSVQAYQIADGSALWALKKINTAIYANDTISSQFAACLNGSAMNLTDNVATFGASASFDLYFLKDDDTTPVGCSDPASSVGRIKAVGKFRNTVRAVDIMTQVPPINWWKMDDGSGTTALDSSSNGRNGTLKNGASWASGKFGGAVVFDGNDDSVSIGDLGSFPSRGTLEFWMNASEIANYRNPLATGAINVGIRFEENAAGSFGMVTGNDSGTYVPQPILDGMVKDRWYHVAYTWDTAANQEARYIDGNQVYSGSHNLWPTNFSNFRIGTGFDDSPGRSWKGLVDDVRLYNYVRTQNQINRDMSGG